MRVRTQRRPGSGGLAGSILMAEPERPDGQCVCASRSSCPNDGRREGDGVSVSCLFRGVVCSALKGGHVYRGCAPAAPRECPTYLCKWHVNAHHTSVQRGCERVLVPADHCATAPKGIHIYSIEPAPGHRAHSGAQCTMSFSESTVQPKSLNGRTLVRTSGTPGRRYKDQSLL